MNDRENRETEYFIELEKKHCAHNYEPLPVVISRAEGVYAWDVDGKKYIDMLSAYSAMSLGHCHPRIVAALAGQAGRLTLTSRAFYNDIMGRFLERICGLAGFEKTLPMNTGAEAVETALKMMRRWAYEVKGVPADRARIVAASGNFHGRTIAIIGMSTSGTARKNFGPFPPGCDIVPFDDAGAIDAAVTDETAGVLLEPLQGEGGVIVPGKDYLPAVREICDHRNALLCLDEIQTGLGRTGKMFCFEHSGIRPDVLTLGKALGGGVFPVSVACADSRVMDVFTPGSHGSTFGGNPLGAAVALEALDVIEEENLAGRAAELGRYFMDGLKNPSLPGVKEVRGMGLLIGVEFEEPKAHDVAAALMEAGLLVKDTRSNIIRLAPPLVITREQIDTALDIIRRVLV